METMPERQFVSGKISVRYVSDTFCAELALRVLRTNLRFGYQIGIKSAQTLSRLDEPLTNLAGLSHEQIP